jgi:hypothetical protein
MYTVESIESLQAYAWRLQHESRQAALVRQVRGPRTSPLRSLVRRGRSTG